MWRVIGSERACERDTHTQKETETRETELYQESSGEQRRMRDIQKSPSSMAKVAYFYGTRDLLALTYLRHMRSSQESPNYVAKEAYFYQKRPISIAKNGLLAIT